MDLSKRTIYDILAVPLYDQTSDRFWLSFATPAFGDSCVPLAVCVLANGNSGRAFAIRRKLPATRDFARQYQLSRGTIVSAFELLKSEGYLRGEVGSGTYVNRILPEALLQATRLPVPRAVVRQRKKSIVSDYGRRVNLFPAFELRPSRAFRANIPALDLFPMNLWAQITARRLRRASVNFMLGCDSMGYAPLRDAVADYLSNSRGVKCVSEQVAIVSGAQEALDLAARLVLNRGDRVCMENPGYVGARMVFEAVGAKISAAPLDDEGMKVRDQSLRGARLVYVTPGHQFPLGITMSLSRRLELLEWARKSGALIFEDDYDSEYRYSGLPFRHCRASIAAGR
jgi:GntR family transcriptional regulator/MocR family aminotransferase